MENGKTVLLIEDEPNIIEALEFVLGRNGWNVISHSDGETAIDAVTANSPNVVILDVMLPNRSGFDILEDLRGLDIGKDLPVLMLTARGQRKDRERAEAAGVSKFMTKPFSNAHISEVLDGLWNDAQARSATPPKAS